MFSQFNVGQMNVYRDDLRKQFEKQQTFFLNQIQIGFYLTYGPLIKVDNNTNVRIIWQYNILYCFLRISDRLPEIVSDIRHA